MTTQDDSTFYQMDESVSRTNLAAELFLIQRGTASRIATLQAHIAANPDSQIALERETKELSSVLATAGFRDLFLKGLVQAKANFLAR